MTDDNPPLFCPLEPSTSSKTKSSSSSDDDPNPHPSAIEFLRSLDLPRIHPHCIDDSVFRSVQNALLPASAEGPSGDEYYYETRTGWTGRGITLSYQVAPAALAVAELWLRLFAFVIAPVALAYLIAGELRVGGVSNVGIAAERRRGDGGRERRNEPLAFLLILTGLSS